MKQTIILKWDLLDQTCTTSSPLRTLPNTTSWSFRSGIGVVVIRSSKSLLFPLFFGVPNMNASCFGLIIRTHVGFDFRPKRDDKHLKLKAKSRESKLPRVKATTELSFSCPFLYRYRASRATSLYQVVFYNPVKRHSLEVIFLTATILNV